MNLEQFDFELPENLIAQTPLEKRDHSLLMIVNRKKQTIEHKHFYDIIDYLQPGDVLVRNNSKVIPARLFGIKEQTGAKVELLLLEQINNNWLCLVGNAKVVKLNTIITFGDGKLKAKCIEVKDEGIRLFKMIHEGIFMEVLDELGTMPLPPYITERLDDKSRYQTVYAKVNGSSAAPTAGFHFTKELFDKIKAKNIQIVDVTLHIGLGTFRPVKTDNILEHKMHSEYYVMDESTANILNKAKKDNKRIISIGTTATRVLETVYSEFNEFKQTSGYTDIFIYPGYQFKAINCLITNFHLPKSTLIMLVSALASKELILKAYKDAVKKEYRFFSFGDSMFIC